MMVNSFWRCASCGYKAEFDDANYDEEMERKMYNAQYACEYFAKN